MDRPAFITERLKKARLQKGLSQKALAEATLFAPSTISGIEKGVIYPSDRALRLIAQALGQKIEYFTDPSISEQQANAIVEETTATDQPLAHAETDNLPATTQNADEASLRLETCRWLVQGSQYQPALETLTELEQSVPPLQAIQRQALIFLRAQALNRTDQPKLARELLRGLVGEVAPLPGTDPVIPALPQVLYEIGASYAIEQQLEAAIENYEAALKALGSEEEIQQYALGFKLYAELGRVWRQLGEPARAAEYYELAHQHPFSQRDDRSRAGLLLSEGLKLVRERHFGAAHSKLAESARLFDKLNMIEQACTVASYLEVVRAELQEFDKLEQTSQTEVLSHLPENSTATTELIVMTNRVAVLRLKDDPESLNQAKAQLERVLQFLNLKRDEIRALTIAQAYHEAALLWTRCNQPEEALEAFKTALVTLRSTEPPHLARWYDYEKIYDDYEQVLLDWGRDFELAQMSRQRLQDKKRF
jgi:transcriptional regulator with XRE-family HTH domain